MANPIFHSQYTAQQIEDLITNGAPIVGQNGHWWRWNVSTQQYEDTGATADAAAAAQEAQEAQEAAEAAQRDAEQALADATEQATHAGQSATAAAASAASAAQLAGDVYKAFPTETASGAVASTAVGADDVPLKSLTAQIEMSQNLNGYDNPWYAGTGANKFGGEIVVGKKWENGSFVDAGNNNYAASEFRIPCEPDMEFRIIMPDTTRALAFYVISFDVNGAYIGQSAYINILTSTKTATFTTGALCYSFAFMFYVSRDEIGQDDVGRCAINYPSTETDWTPYENYCPITGETGLTIYRSGADTSNPDEFSATWQLPNGVLYAGTVDVVRGVFTVRRVRYSIKGTETISLPSSGNYRRFIGLVTGTSFGSLPAVRTVLTAASSSFIRNNGAAATPLPFGYFRFSTDSYVIFYDENSRFQTVSDFKAALAQAYADNKPVQIAYDCEPFDVQFSPADVRSLLGITNIWAANGEVTAIFRGDPNLYISARLANLGVIIKGQPVDFIGAVGDTASFTVVAVGEGLTYQWQWKNSQGVWKDQDYPSFKLPTLSVDITEARIGYTYRCRVTDTNGYFQISDEASIISG